MPLYALSAAGAAYRAKNAIIQLHWLLSATPHAARAAYGTSFFKIQDIFTGASIHIIFATDSRQTGDERRHHCCRRLLPPIQLPRR